MNTALLAAIDTAGHTIAAPPSGSVPLSVLLIIGLGGTAWWMFKHGDKTKKLHLGPGFVCLGLGLSLSGTQLGNQIGVFLGSLAQMLATFVGNA